jgi:hypothetical protein
MFSSLLVIAVVGGALFGVHRWRALPEEERMVFAKKGIMYGTAIIVLALVLSGKAHWLMGVLAALLALAARAAQFAQYAPLFKKFMGTEEPSQQGSNDKDVQSTASMSRQVAADILGVDASASKDEIKIAHKRLMQKIHPDRGGTDALAKQINLAKDTLLKL